jgi:hypothetical protein
MTENAMMIFKALVSKYGARTIQSALREARRRQVRQ